MIVREVFTNNFLALSDCELTPRQTELKKKLFSEFSF